MTSGLPPQPQPGWNRTLWTLVFWALVIVGSIALVQLASSRRQETAGISYSEFVRELERGNVAAVEISGRTKLSGDFKSPLLFAGRREQHFTTILPFESSDAWVSTLLAKGVDVRGGREQQSFAVFLFSLLPYALILGLILFMLRRQRQA